MKIDDIAKMFTSYQKVDDFLAAVGYGAVSPQQIATRLVETQEREVLPAKAPDTSQPVIAKGLTVTGVGNLLMQFANCCRPVYGDPIVGYITRGRGITVHRTDCPNVRNVDDEARLTPVSWGDQRESYPVTIRVEAWDRVGLLRDITTLVADERVNMESVLTNTNSDQTVTVLITFNVGGLAQLSQVLHKLESVRDVFEVRRESTPVRAESSSRNRGLAASD
jgi:GTP pyrophosphokinase